MKKAFVKAYGCQMNVYDAERMADVLRAEGYGAADGAEDADVVVLNTCHIREKAAEKVYSELGRLRVLKEERAAQGRETRIVVAGCVAQAEGGEILRRQSAVDAVVGPQSYHRLPELLRTPRAVDTDFPVVDKFSSLPARARPSGPTAFLTVQEGCDKFCAFCVVPYTRGAEVSRPVAAIVAEAERLAEGGARELTLIGQNVNAYHGDGEGGAWSLGRLMRRLADIPGIARLRYTTSHPRDMDDDLIAAHRDLPAAMPYLHLPVQTGSDRVLAAMNRRHTRAEYLDLVDRIRRARPDIALTSDFIVGFPGETASDFADTLALVEAVGYAGAFSFKYSPRPGTPAAGSEDAVPEAVKAERLARLQAAIEAGRQAFNRACIGRTLDVLVEKPGRHPGQVGGKTPYLQAIHFDGGADLVGQVVPVRVLREGANSLTGALADAPAAGGPVAAESGPAAAAA